MKRLARSAVACAVLALALAAGVGIGVANAAVWSSSAPFGSWSSNGYQQRRHELHHEQLFGVRRLKRPLLALIAGRSTQSRQLVLDT